MNCRDTIKNSIKVFLLFFWITNTIYSQPCSKNPWEWLSHSNWFIGNGLKGKFSGGTLTISTIPSSITSYEGTTAASDDKGNLLFLSNGRQLWDANNTLKYSGLLEGDENGSTYPRGSAAQGIISIRHPLDTGNYYILTTDDALMGTANGLNYFVFDRNGNLKSGPTRLGTYRTTEGISATKHFNGVDIWVTVWGANTNNFYTYLITCTGLVSTPVISSVAPNTLGDANKERGGLAFSWDSKRFAQVHGDYSPHAAQSVSVYLFDNKTGIISDAHDIADPVTFPDIVSPYDVLFSPDNSKLYISTSQGKLCYFDVSSWNTATMSASCKSIAGVPGGQHSAIEIGTDGNLYMARMSGLLGKLTGSLNTGTLTYSSVTGANTNMGLPTMYLPPAEEPDILEVGPFCVTDPPVNLSTFWLCCGLNAEDSIALLNTYSGTGITNGVIGIFDPSVAGIGTHMIIFKRCNVDDTTYITVTPCALNITVTATQTGCTVNSGTATAIATSGTPPYTYSWSNGQTTSTATGLSAGTYTVSVTDSKGSSSTQTVTITQIPGPTATISGSTPSDCKMATGTATVTASGGTPSYSYNWSNGQTTNSATGLSEGSHTVTVTDTNGCTKTQTVLITSTSTLALNTTSTQTGCIISNGTATANASNGAPSYTYNWSNGQTTPTATGLAAGLYTVTVTDANGCIKKQTVSVTQIPGPTANATATPAIIPPGGNSVLTATGGGTYLWTPSTGLSCTSCPNPIATPAQPTDYCVLVTDTNGCKDSTCIRIDIEIPCETLFIPGAFSPNDDGENDIQCVMGTNCIEKIIFAIYDRWGEKIFETSDPRICWDGKYRGKPLNTAVFVYYLKASFTNGDEITRKGNISLIR